jgi:hypothetical protein
MNKDERWLCLDCGKNTFEGRDDWYFLRNRLWRQLVPRQQRHVMICRACIERRLGRQLTGCPQVFTEIAIRREYAWFPMLHWT